jgi:hypothetical protein
MVIFQLIAVPFMILNVFGVLGGAIWLAILGQWSLLGIGLLSMFFSSTVIGIATMPGTGIALLATPFLEKRAWFLGFPFILAGKIYIAAVITAWCLAVVVFVLGKAGPEATLPALLWAYCIAITPLSYMTQVSQPDFGATVATMGAQFAVIAMAAVVLTKEPDLTTLIIACAVPNVIAVVLSATVTFLLMRESAAQRSAEN